MYLPFDAALGICAQDDGFLDKPRWDFAATAADQYPLLLHFHPLTIYRHQVCKQADVVLALVLDGKDVPMAVKRASRSEEHTSELQSLMRNSYADFCLKNKKTTTNTTHAPHRPH